jgi:hypothetical protein
MNRLETILARFVDPIVIFNVDYETHVSYSVGIMTARPGEVGSSTGKPVG